MLNLLQANRCFLVGKNHYQGKWTELKAAELGGLGCSKYDILYLAFSIDVKI